MAGLTPAQQAILDAGTGAGAAKPSAADWIVVKGGDGNSYLVNKITKEVAPLPGVPGNLTASDKKLEKGADGRFYLIDPATGAATPISGMPADTSTDVARVPGTGTPAIPARPDYSGTSQGQSDLSGPSMVGGQPAGPDTPVTAYNAETARQNADLAQWDALQKQKETEYQHGLDAIQQKHADGVLSLEQAKQAALELHQSIQEDLQRSSQALTSRGQDITAADSARSAGLTQRGQDLSAATAARGQDLSYLGNQSYVSGDQYQAIQAGMGNLAKTGGVPFTPSATPPGLGYDPAAISRQLAQQVLSGQQPNTGFSLGQK